MGFDIKERILLFKTSFSRTLLNKIHFYLRHWLDGKSFLQLDTRANPSTYKQTSLPFPEITYSFEYCKPSTIYFNWPTLFFLLL